KPHIADSQRLIRTIEGEFHLGPVKSAIEPHAERSILRLRPARLDQEGAVLPPDALARQSQLGRIKLEVFQVQYAVGAALEVGCEARQAAGQRGEEAVVEPPDPGLRLADDACGLAAWGGHDPPAWFGV